MNDSSLKFITAKDAEFQRDLDSHKLRWFKDIDRHGEHGWLREAWTFGVQSNYASKVHVIERFRLHEWRGDHDPERGGAQVGDIEYRLGYWVVGRVGRAKGRWWWGQSALLVPAADLLPLLRKAVDNGTIRKEDVDGGRLF